MYKIKYIILLIIILIISSCASQKEILIPANQDDIRVETHLLNNDIEAIINDVYDLPLKRNLLTDYILFDCNLEDYNYAELINFVKLSQADSLLHIHFQNIVSDREDQIIDYINSLSIIEIADYYKNTPTEQSFLHPIISTAISSNIEDADYMYVRGLRSAFINTNIEDIINPTYYLLRENMLTTVKAVIDKYSKTEEEIFAALKHNINVEIIAYIEDNYEKAISKCIKDKLPTKNSEIRNYVCSTINNTLQPTEIKDIFQTNIQEYNKIINDARTQLTQELLENPCCHHLNHDNIREINPIITSKIPLNNLSEISELQNSINWLSWGLTAASFFTGGVTGLIVGAVDLVYGITSEMSDSEKLNVYIHNFSNEMGPIIVDYYSTQTESLLNKDEQENIINRRNFNKYIYENF